MDTKNTQNTPADFGNASLRTRLIICALVLVVGFAMGWLNGRGTTDNSGIVSQQTAAQGAADGTQSDSGSGSESQSSPDQSSGKNGGSGSSQSSNSGQSSSKGDDSNSGQSSKKDKDARSSKKNDQSSTNSGTQSQKSDAGSSANSGTQDQKSDADSSSDSGSSTVAPERGPTVTEDGTYTSKDEVALYIHTYGHLPSNFIGKKKASDRGWVPSEGNLQEVCPGMSIGGSKFYNDDGQLPDKKGRQWTECDINYHGGHRGAERIVFSNDGLVFYTGDHYKTFEQLY